MWEILDKTRIRPNGSRGRRVVWPCSRTIYLRAVDLFRELEEIEGLVEPDQVQRRYALMDEVMGLPGYPRDYDPDRDVIDPQITSEMR